jgi:penicillin-binding protein 1A
VPVACVLADSTVCWPKVLPNHFHDIDRSASSAFRYDQTAAPSASLAPVAHHADHAGGALARRRILTPLAQIPEHLRRAVIAVEDVRFFEHPGLDYIGILRAAWTNLRRGGKVEGASTITQQLARSLFLSSERTFDRKVRELVLAYKMELVSTK